MFVKKSMLVSVLLLCVLVLVSGCQKEPTWQELYDAGLQYAEEEDYEQAIASFEEAIALDSSRPEAYGALADVYLAMENLEKALAVLQQGAEATSDETLKARAEEIAAQLIALSGPQKPAFMVEYLGMTVNEIAALWGEDYTTTPDLYLGGEKGVHYADNRVPVIFYFYDPLNNGIKTGEEEINLIEISSDVEIAEGFSYALTHPELEDAHPEGSFSFFEESGTGATYTCKYRDDISIIYEWEYGSDPETTSAPWVSLYMEGLDTQESTQNTQISQPSWKALYESELNQALRSASDPSLCRYYVYDINGDGTPELIEGLGTCRADYTFHVYTTKNGSLLKVGELAGDQLGVFGEQNTIFGYYAQMGYETILVYSMANDSITETARYEKESPNGYMNLTFLDSFALHDLSGLYWTKNSSSKNDVSLLNEFSGI